MNCRLRNSDFELASDVQFAADCQFLMEDCYEDWLRWAGQDREQAPFQWFVMSANALHSTTKIFFEAWHIAAHRFAIN
jgi:hypothetical protein